MRKVSASAKLYLLLFVMSSFIIGIGIYGMLQLRSMQQNTKIIFFDELLSLDYLTTMRYSYYDGVQSTIRAYTDGDPMPDSARTQLAANMKKIDSCWLAYRATYLTPPETDLIRTSDPLVAHTDTLARRLIAGGMKEDNKATIADLNATIAQLTPRLESLIRLQVKVSDEFYHRNQKVYRTTLQNYPVLAVLALILALALGTFIVSDISRLISNLEKSHNSLAESERKYRYLFDNTPVIMTIWDPATAQVLELNRKATEAYGTPKDKSHWLENFYAQQQEDMQVLQGFIREIANNKSTFSRKIWHHTRIDGEMRYTDIISHSIMYHGRPALLAIVEDVTEQYRTEENSRRRSEEIKDINQRLQTAREDERSHLAAEIEDELGRYISLLREDISRIDRETREAGPQAGDQFAGIYEHLDQAATHIRRIITRLLTPSQF